jgi:hypothetical protein
MGLRNLHFTVSDTIKDVTLNSKFIANLWCNIPVVIFNEIFKAFQLFYLTACINIIINIIIIIMGAGIA